MDLFGKKRKAAEKERREAMLASLKTMMSREVNEKPRTPATLDEIKKAAAYFDDRDFEVGAVIMKRRDGKDMDKGGYCNDVNPARGEPAIIIAKTSPARREGAGYENNTLVVLCKYANGEKMIRVQVDPVHFERYVAPEPGIDLPHTVTAEDDLHVDGVEGKLPEGTVIS